MGSVSYVFLLYFVAWSCVKDGHALTSNEKCSVLEKAIAIFIKDRVQPDTLYSIFDVNVVVTDKLLDNLQKSSAYDFVTDTRDLHRFACKVAGATSRRDLGNILGIGRSTIGQYFQTLLGPIRDVGGVQHMKQIAGVVDILFSWAESSGYPVMPLKRIDDKATLKTFETVKTAMEKKYIHGTLINAPFPLKVTPFMALKHLKAAKSYSDFEKAVFLDPHQLEEFAAYVKNHKNALAIGSKNMKSTLVFLEALDQTGILSLI